MSSQHNEPASPNYAAQGSAKSIKYYRTGYVGKLRFEEVKALGLTTKKLDHSVGNLADSSSKFSPIDLKELIRRTQAGELGSTEVHPNQVW